LFGVAVGFGCGFGCGFGLALTTVGLVSGSAGAVAVVTAGGIRDVVAAPVVAAPAGTADVALPLFDRLLMPAPSAMPAATAPTTTASALARPRRIQRDLVGGISASLRPAAGI
jgi:hypothetical protein